MLEDEKSELIKEMVSKIRSALDMLHYYQNMIKSDNPGALQALYACQSILLIEKYKLEETSIDAHQKIKRLVVILKHLSMKELAYAVVLRDKVFLAKQWSMFERIYQNHLYVVLNKNANLLEIAKIEKVFKIMKYLVGSNKKDKFGENECNQYLKSINV